MAKAPKPEHVEEFHIEHQRRHSCVRGCCLTTLVVFLILGGGTAFLAARSGVATIPGISRLAYTPPQPIKDIPSPVIDEQAIEDRLMAAEQAAQKGEISLWLSEDEITYLVRQKQPDATIALLDGKIEWFGPQNLAGRTVDVTVTATPLAENGKLRVRIESVKIGQLGLPTGALNWAGEFLQERLLDTNELIKQIELKEVRVEEGKIYLTGKVPPGFGNEFQ